jgi:hypothetical protein
MAPVSRAFEVIERAADLARTIRLNQCRPRDLVVLAVGYRHRSPSILWLSRGTVDQQR